jgi:glycosyltransferase involved in cell wall biosynthesis
VFAQAGSARLAGKLIVLPNGVEDRGGNISATRTHWAFVGRLTREKGIGELLEVWPADEPLIVAGDGELRNHLERIAPSSVRFAGVLDQARVDDVLKSAWSLVLPSRWYEGFPTVVGEALMHGTPVIARDGSSGADFVEAMGVGSVYSDVPFEAMKAIAAEYPRLSRRSRHVYVERLSREAWTELLHQLYVQLAEEFHRAVGQRNC